MNENFKIISSLKKLNLYKCRLDYKYEHCSDRFHINVKKNMYLKKNFKLIEDFKLDSIDFKNYWVPVNIYITNESFLLYFLSYINQVLIEHWECSVNILETNGTKFNISSLINKNEEFINIIIDEITIFSNNDYHKFEVIFYFNDDYAAYIFRYLTIDFIIK